MIVAIDGPAGVGKSSVAGYIAEHFKCYRLNSGNFYRTLTLNALKNGLDLNNETVLIQASSDAHVEIRNDEFYLNGRNVNQHLHCDDVDSSVSAFSGIVEIRHIVNNLIRKVCSGLNVVAEGRDMTTVVFPDADVKIYMDATPEARAKRRYEQGVSELSYEEILTSIQVRDHNDKNKKEGSLQISEDAIYLDTSGLTLDQVCAKVSDKINDLISTQEKKEIMAEMDAISAEDNNQTELQEQYLKSLDQLEEGQLVDGEVIQLDSEYVYISIGYKSDGKIPLSDFIEAPEIGSTVSVVVVKREGKNGELIVSKKKADSKVIWKDLKKASEENLSVKAVVKKVIKGGFEVSLGSELTAFVPISKMDVERIEEPEKYVGLESEFHIERLYNDKKVNVVLNRRSWLEKDISKRKADFFANTEIGATVTGAVKSFTSFGAFVDLGGFDGLLHINDMSWGHVTRPKDFVKKGQEIELKVIRLDSEEEKINLSLKHFTDDPWTHFEAKYSIDDVVAGKVTKLTDFGAFIELEEGIEGLAHISELSWVKRIKHPREILSIGDEVEIKILGYDIQQGRISLGLKQVLPNPWDEIETNYPVGTKLKKIVKKITAAGAFIELEEGIDGFLHADDLSWTKKIKNISSVMAEGDEVDVTVTSVDPESRRIRLGVKQLSDDPWEALRASFPKGSIIEGEITNITDFGLFIKVQGDIEGLIHKSNLSEDRDEDVEELMKKYSIGDKISAAVTELNPQKQKLSLSIKEKKLKEQKKEISKYLVDSKDEDEGTYTLADMLKSKDS